MTVDKLKAYKVIEREGYVLITLLGTESTNYNIKHIVRQIRNKGEKRPIYINAELSLVCKIAGNPWIYIPEMNRIHTEVLIDCILSNQGEEEIKDLYTSKKVEREIEYQANEIIEMFKYSVIECCDWIVKSKDSLFKNEIANERKFLELLNEMNIAIF